MAEAARRLGIEPAELLARLIRDGFVYRCTGIGRPLAYVRWVRAGLFVNTATEVRITGKGFDHLARALKTP
jgi:hypothetical protein